MLGIVMPPTDVPLICGLVLAKLTVQEEEEGLTSESASFFSSYLLHHKMLHGGGRLDGMCIGG
jgi:hypothetical protein